MAIVVADFVQIRELIGRRILADISLDSLYCVLVFGVLSFLNVVSNLSFLEFISLKSLFCNQKKKKKEQKFVSY